MPAPMAPEIPAASNFRERGLHQLLESASWLILERIVNGALAIQDALTGQTCEDKKEYRRGVEGADE